MSGENAPSALHWLKGWEKLRYILDYYKLPIILVGILLYIVVWFTIKTVTKKDVVLYLGLVNVAPTEELALQLSDEYLKEAVYPKSDYELYLYRNLFMSADESSEYHAYSYATKMKILGAIDAEQLDVVLMNKEAFDSFSQNGYLWDLQELLSGPASSEEDQALYRLIEDNIQMNIIIQEDNSTDVLLGNEKEYKAVTTTGGYGLDLTSASRLISRENLSGTVYLGVLVNTPRRQEAVRYLSYLVSHGDRFLDSFYESQTESSGPSQSVLKL